MNGSKKDFIFKLFWNPKTYFSLSPFGLAILRIGIGLGVVVEAVERLRNFAILHATTGLFPIDFSKYALYKITGEEPLLPNIYDLNTSDAFQISVIILQLILGLALAVGFHRKWTGPLLFYLLCCSNLRMYLILKGGDTMALWGTFLALCLPTFQVWSLTKRSVGADPSSFKAQREITLVYMLIVIAIYHFTGVNKDDPTWFNGKAIDYALRGSYMTTSFGSFLAQFPGLTQALSYAVVPLEKWAAFLLLVPSPVLRIGVCGLFIFFHLTIWASLHLGNLSLLMIAIWIGLLPSEFFSRWKMSLPSISAIKLTRTELYAPLLVLTVGLLFLLARNIGVRSESDFLKWQSNSFGQFVRRFGLLGGVSFYTRVADTTTWPRFLVESEQGDSRYYDLFGDRWLPVPTIESPPEDIFGETIHSRRFEGVMEIMLGPGFRDYSLQFQRTLCRKAYDPIKGTEPRLITGKIFYIPLSEATERIASRNLFKVDCRYIQPWKQPKLRPAEE